MIFLLPLVPSDEIIGSAGDALWASSIVVVVVVVVKAIVVFKVILYWDFLSSDDENNLFIKLYDVILLWRIICDYNLSSIWFQFSIVRNT